MNTSGFITSLITSFVIFLLLLILHALLSRRPGNFVVYYPNRIIKGLATSSALRSGSLNPFFWMQETWRASDEDVVNMAGLDAAVYLSFLRTGLSIFFYSAIAFLPLLLPLSATDNGYENQSQHDKSSISFTNFDKLAMGNVTNGSDRLWAFLIATYWLSLVIYFMLWKTYKYVLQLRKEDQAAEEAKPEQFTILVRDIPHPKHGTIAVEVDKFFRTRYPESFQESLVVVDIKKVLKVWKELESCRKQLHHAEAVYGESNNVVRPQHRIGKFGLYGKKVDSLDYLNQRIKDLLITLEKEQTVAREQKQQRAAFVFFNSRETAVLASQARHGEFAKEWTVMSAPEPRDVVWENLPIPLLQRLIRGSAAYVLVFLTVCFYMIPIAFISAIIALDNLEKKLTFLKPVIEQKEINTILQAFLPQLALIVFLALLPMFLIKLSRAEGIPSQSHVGRAAAGKYFYFNVFNVFLGVTITGTLFQSPKDFNNQPTSIVSPLSKAHPPQSSFFITFVALRFFVGYGLELSRVASLVIYHLKRRYLCKTEEEVREAWAPSAINYATVVPGDILVLTIALYYAIIAPIILPFAIVYFALGWLVMKHQAMNVYVASFESGGRMWPHIHTRILAALFVAQLTMLGYLGLKGFGLRQVLMVPLPISTLVFAHICQKLFYPSFLSPSLIAALKEMKQVPRLSTIVAAYTPTCLLPQDPDYVNGQKFEDSDPEKFEDARSNLSSRTSSGMMSPA